MSSTRTQAEMRDWLRARAPRHYRKQGRFEYELVRDDQLVRTVIDGITETENTAHPGDYILTGTKGERFVLKPDAFAKRYADLGNGLAEARGECWAVCYEGPGFSFEAPWDGAAPIHCFPGDYLVAPDEAISEVYRVEAAVFAETYVSIS